MCALEATEDDSREDPEEIGVFGSEEDVSQKPHEKETSQSIAETNGC